MADKSKPVMDLRYLWNYLKRRFPIGFLFGCALAIESIVFANPKNPPLDIPKLLLFWALFMVVVSFMPYSRVGGPDPELLFPRGPKWLAWLLDVLFGLLCLLVFGSLAVFVIDNFEY